MYSWNNLCNLIIFYTIYKEGRRVAGALGNVLSDNENNVQ